MIPYGRQTIDDRDIAAVAEVLRSNFLTQGEAVPRFESIVASRVGAASAVAVCNATAALHVTYLALGLSRGDLLWTVPNTFVATANAARFCGAEVDFVDIDARTFLMDPDELEIKLAAADKNGRLPKIIVPVHFAGQSCDMRRIASLTKRYGIHIVEDASHAVGGSYAGEAVGCCRYSDVTVFSFHPVKIITTGEGGMCLTNDMVLAERMRLLRSHGITKDPVLFERPPDGSWDYRQITLGFNYRMTDIQAALGTAQFARLPDFLDRRSEIASAYNDALAHLPVMLPRQDSQTSSSWHLYIVEVAAEHRRAVFDQMVASGIGVQVLYIPVHRQPYYEALGFRAGDFPRAETFYQRSFTLPIFPSLSDVEQSMVVEALRKATFQQAPEVITGGNKFKQRNAAFASSCAPDQTPEHSELGGHAC